MTAELKPYPIYKAAEVPWPGTVPAHWAIRRLKQICRLAYGDALATGVRQDGVIPVFGSNGRVGFHNSANTKSPCIVIGRKGSFGKVNFSRDPVFAIDTTFFVDSRLSSAHIRWLYFLLGWLRLDEVSKDSAVPGLDREDAYQKLAVLPPLAEQTAIVRYLDHVDRRIQRYIRAKQKLIALLEEQKQAVIHQAVTGQIDVRTGRPYPAYKDSGVEWLGKVPEHWGVRRCGGVFREVVDTGYGDAELLSIDRFVGVVRQTETGRKQRASEDRSTYKRVRQGQLAYNLMNAFMGSIGGSALDGILSPAYAVAEPLGQVDTFFFHHLLRTQLYTSQFYRYSYEIMYERNRLYFDRFKQIPLLVPPYVEQKAIVVALTAASVEFSRLVECLNRQIQLVTEYRTRLISDVVTGKLDVGEAVARLQDGIEEPQPCDGDEAWSEPVDDGIERLEALH